MRSILRTLITLVFFAVFSASGVAASLWAKDAVIDKLKEHEFVSAIVFNPESRHASVLRGFVGDLVQARCPLVSNPELQLMPSDWAGRLIKSGALDPLEISLLRNEWGRLGSVRCTTATTVVASLGDRTFGKPIRMSEVYVNN